MSRIRINETRVEEADRVPPPPPLPSQTHGASEDENSTNDKTGVGVLNICEVESEEEDSEVI
jgi:hypothetical protein